MPKSTNRPAVRQGYRGGERRRTIRRAQVMSSRDARKAVYWYVPPALETKHPYLKKSGALIGHRLFGRQLVERREPSILRLVSARIQNPV